MRYNAPFGNSDMDASYVNGNPETGVMGSIPPAESIEYPQRELHHFINFSGLAPTNADLNQLAKAVQMGKVNYGADVGEPNKIAITPVVPISGYSLGLRFIIKVGYGNTSSVTVNVSGYGQVPLIHTDLTPMLAYELLAGQLIEVAYDGANFQAIAGVQPGGSSVTLTAPTYLYVNANTGDDTLYDGTSAAPTGEHGGPFRTLQKALATMTKYNLGGWFFYIMIAPGVYTSTDPISFPLPNGSGVVSLQGNSADPAATLFFNTGKGCVWRPASGGYWHAYGFSYRATAPMPGDNGGGVWVAGSTTWVQGHSQYEAMPGTNLISGPTSFMFIDGDHAINGNCAAHHHGYANGVNYNNTGIASVEPTMTIKQPINISQAFSMATHGGQTREMWRSITGAANVTGRKYWASMNGTVDSAQRGENYLPGTIAGWKETGGQYS